MQSSEDPLSQVAGPPNIVYPHRIEFVDREADFYEAKQRPD